MQSRERSELMSWHCIALLLYIACNMHARARAMYVNWSVGLAAMLLRNGAAQRCLHLDNKKGQAPCGALPFLVCITM